MATGQASCDYSAIIESHMIIMDVKVECERATRALSFYGCDSTEVLVVTGQKRTMGEFCEKLVLLSNNFH